ncbi:unnamed protein product [Menidia menidia]|uniref:(Atlantic silverside) hypothetical protein n=1 Tax=Menidia menidia TaxID=238744 RepID=A0A8S4BT88_9TELE|nr:unnamed protein product [Menidia menidia]
MVSMPSKSALLWFLFVVTGHVTEAAGRPKWRTTLPEDESLSSFRSTTGPGPEPGDLAAAFKVLTLDGELSYEPGALRGSSLVVHAFTNKSGFLECLWSSEPSLSSLVEGLPDSTRVLFVSLDDSALSDALKEVLTRLHFSPVPAFALGNWIPGVLHSWGCRGHNCGLSQAVFTSYGWKMPVIAKRLDARYDWLMARWKPGSYRLVGAGDGCLPSASAAGGVAWVSEGNCSFFTKVLNMAKSNASGVLVYSLPGNPIRDMNCAGDECSTPLSIPAAMVHPEVSVSEALRFEKPDIMSQRVWHLVVTGGSGLCRRLGQVVNVSFQTTPSPNFFIGIDQQGALAEMGWFLYPSFSFINWQAQWFEFSADLQIKLQTPARVVSVFDRMQMQGEKGAVATVELPSDLQDFDTLELDAGLSCPGRRDQSCAQWDHSVQLLVCCDPLGPACNAELGRWITAFRRGSGRWLTDVSPLIPLLDSHTCTFTMKTAPWAMPWMVSLNLRFRASNQTAGGPSTRTTTGGSSPSDSPSRRPPRRYGTLRPAPPAPARPPDGAVGLQVELYAVITGHGSDENGCGEFCVTSHHFLTNGVFNNTRVFDSAGTALGCTMRVRGGAVPNEHGTWLYGRGGWCDGLQVDPWRTDITRQLDMSGLQSNTVVYFGLFQGKDPNPSQPPGYITMSSFLVFYK